MHSNDNMTKTYKQQTNKSTVIPSTIYIHYMYKKYQMTAFFYHSLRLTESGE